MSFPLSLKKSAGLLCAMMLSFVAMSALDSEEAHADVLVGVDLNGGIQLGDVSSDSLGLGANLRVGWQEDFIPLLRLAPEFQLNYMGFALDNENSSGITDTADSANLRLLSPRVGARVGVDMFLFGFALYSHVGYGFLNAGGGFSDDNGLSFDAGLAIDFVAVPFVNLGIHGGYNSFAPSSANVDAITWIDLGLHAEVVF